MSRRAQTAACGTDSGYYRHLRRTKTKPCKACRKAHSAAAWPARQLNTMEITARDQLRILAAGGWSCETLAPIALYSAFTLAKARQGTPPITAAVAAAIGGVYERLWWREGPSKRTADAAKERGWDLLNVEPATGPVVVAS